MTAEPPRLKHFGWGREGEEASPAERAAARARYAKLFGTDQFADLRPPPLAALRLPEARLRPPQALAAFCTDALYDRAAHTYGKSYPDTVRGLAGDYQDAPDLVAYPPSEEAVADLLAFAADRRAAVIPFGGGSSVVGGVTPVGLRARYPGVIALDLSRLARVRRIDPVSRAAEIEAGIFGPALEAALKPSGLTLRHFPQSFAYSTLGGWIATRSGGHFATLFTHIDEMVESLRLITPAGPVETRRLPASGAGPQPERLFIGSEGILGVITRAFLRLHPRPRFRAGGAVLFPDFFAAARAVRDLLQAGLYPANCRILDEAEAAHTGAGDGRTAVMVLGFESADHPVEAAMARALECCAAHGGRLEPDSGPRAGAAERWRTAFIRMPYLREHTVGWGVIADTFETAITWDRFEAFHQQVMEATERAIRTVTGRPGLVSCRFTHAYPDGPAPYYSFHALGAGEPHRLLEQWAAIKGAASEALLAAGGTITHHHAVGRDHRPWYDRERPPLFAQALAAAKRTLDPAGLLNPGVLIDPLPA
jgi:alkyldihydroxyacetonephosphate synthase